METDFWHKMWATGVVGFHQQDINDYLKTHWQKLNLNAPSQVLVPLSGKTLDMLWLREQGHSVLGVELSQKALDEFIAENHLSAENLVHEKFCGYQLAEMQLYCGDFFHLSAEDCQAVKAVYDRAALVALPPQMRAEYTVHLQQILPKATPILLIAMDYDTAQRSGPPFAVSEAEVYQLYSAAYDIEIVQQETFQRKGLETVETTYILKPRQ